MVFLDHASRIDRRGSGDCIFRDQISSRPTRTKATHLHSNTRLEIIWTIVPTLILGSLAFGSERVWKKYRSSPDLDNPNRSKILVIGQQFKWNVIYPGPDGKFGRYLSYPKPTDAAWPVGPDGLPTRFRALRGPPPFQRKKRSKRSTPTSIRKNPLGKDFADPDGKDDDWSFARVDRFLCRSIARL